MKYVLIVYSNPDSWGRIRLDKEHRVLDQISKMHNLNKDAITRRHATSLEDFTKAMGERAYDLIQFSGHGEPNGFVFESSLGERDHIVTSDQIRQIVTKIYSLRFNFGIFESLKI